jgi:ABC-2 type transport system permease protein
MFSGAVVLVVQVILIVLLGLILGLDPASGFAGLVLVVFFAFLWGMGFAGYAAFMALRTKNAAAAQAATFAFFPLIFLSSTFVPREFIEVRWLKIAATVNPTTYVFEAMRSLLLTGWEAKPVFTGLAVVLGFSTLTGVLALIEARRATSLAST